ncbi:KIF13B [Symbiodinium sp. CCMP2456]|nr:KIF13B [Symbiodinium sp. CCMP2456]
MALNALPPPSNTDLRNSLGGNSYTTLLTTVDPSAANYEESLNSLFFADRCQNVQNKPIQNVAKADAEGNERQISKLTLEIVNLKHQLEVAGAALGPLGPSGCRSVISLGFRGLRYQS